MKKTIIFLVACFFVISCNSKPEVKPDMNEELTVRVYPNPVIDRAFIEVYNQSNQSFKIQIFDTKGKRMLEERGGQGQQQYNISFSDEPKGSYQIILQTDASIIRKKIIKI